MDMAEAAGKANWKRGRVYFRMVCTVCHIQTTGSAVAPSSRTIAEWKAYMEANKHDTTGQTKPKVTDYISKEYRESIKDSNKAAKKFRKMSDQALTADVTTFVGMVLRIPIRRHPATDIRYNLNLGRTQWAPIEKQA